MNSNNRNSKSVGNIFGAVRFRRGMAWGLIILGALVSF